MAALGVVLISGGAMAQAGTTEKASAPASTQASTNYKIGVVDMQTILAEYNKRKAKYAELQKEVEALQKDIDDMSTRIETAKKSYEDGQGKMSDDDRFDLKTKIESDYATYRAELEKRQKLIDSKEERVLKEVLTDVEDAINKVAASENYHLILNAKSGPRGSVLYHSPTIDITSKVLAQLNSK
jgi:Skp family chaperone for outer membrane proteins